MQNKIVKTTLLFDHLVNYIKVGKIMLYAKLVSVILECELLYFAFKRHICIQTKQDYA
jgi:hypothetical protein